MIITAQADDTAEKICKRYGLNINNFIADNGLNERAELANGMSLEVVKALKTYFAALETTVTDISKLYNIPDKELYRNNYVLGGKNVVKKNIDVIIENESKPVSEKIIGGYAYDWIQANTLLSVINYLTYIMPFTYGFTPEGELTFPNDSFIIKTAKNANVKCLMHLSTINGDSFDSMLPGKIFSDKVTTEVLIENIIAVVVEKGFCGVDVDFEYLPSEQRESYISFIREISDSLHALGKILIVALPPKTSDTQRGLLYEGIDYYSLGLYADYLLLMTYEWGYKYGPPMAVAPLNQVEKVVDYALTRIDNKKLLLGLSNYGYDWTIPYVRGKSDAPSLSTVEAINLAIKYGAEIKFDETSKAPYFKYTDENKNEHEVWYEDSRSFKAKIDLINSKNLSGGFIWELSRINPQGYVTLNQNLIIP